ncbi:MAG TPA: hypothetical protein VGD38_13965 [Pyrinomonadaceae bacterium]
MRSTTLYAGAFAALAFASVGEAQTPRSSSISVNRGAFAVAPYAGYLVSQNFFEGPLNTSLGVQGASVYGAQFSMALAPGASLVGAMGYGSGDLEAGIPIFGGISVGQTSTLLLDASVELRLENSTKRFIPVFQLGGGAIRREVTIAGMNRDAFDFQVSGAIGADLPLARNIAVRLMAKDYVGKADFGTINLGSLGTLEASTKDLHTVALTGGLRIEF